VSQDTTVKHGGTSSLKADVPEGTEFGYGFPGVSSARVLTADAGEFSPGDTFYGETWVYDGTEGDNGEQRQSLIEIKYTVNVEDELCNVDEFDLVDQPDIQVVLEGGCQIKHRPFLSAADIPDNEWALLSVSSTPVPEETLEVSFHVFNFTFGVEPYTSWFDDTLFRFGNVALPGDFNQDGQLSEVDVNLLIDAIVAGGNAAAFDLTNDQLVNQQDLQGWVKDLRRTWIGDASLDGEFNSADFVKVFQAGKFEQNVAATWGEGDWTGDHRFNSSDFVAAFQDGGFERGPRGATPGVPEPSGLALVLIGSLCLLRKAAHSR
jgi:hypothetical protein